MTVPFDTAPEADDRPAGAGTALLAWRRPRTSRMARVLRWWLGLSVVVLLACAVFVGTGIHTLDLAPVQVVINGDDLTNGLTITGLGDDAQTLLGVGALMLALLLLLLIPVLLLLIVAALAIALVLGIGVSLVVLALTLAVATSPFWAVVLVVWLIARRRRSPALPALPSSARMSA